MYLSWQKLNGRVVTCINADEPQDLALQGYRYYVDAGGFRWSVPESGVLPEHRRLGGRVQGNK